MRRWNVNRSPSLENAQFNNDASTNAVGVMVVCDKRGGRPLRFGCEYGAFLALAAHRVERPITRQLNISNSKYRAAEIGNYTVLKRP